MIDNNLRNFILKNRDEVKKIILTNNQIKIFRLVQDFDGGYITYSELSKIMGITIHAASMNLNRLYKAGYLKRRKATSLTGHKVYLYRVAFLEK